MSRPGCSLRSPATTVGPSPTPWVTPPTPSDVHAPRVCAHGRRNPYRSTFKPEAGDLWIAYSGFNTWEVLTRLTNPNAAPRNVGWPCYEGNAVLPAYDGLGLSICQNLTPAEVTLPYYTYDHRASVVAGDGCSVGSSSVSDMVSR